MSTKRPIAWSVAAIAAVTLLASAYALAKRIEAYHADHERTIYYFIRTDRMQFTFADRRVSFEPDLDEDGAGTLTLRYQSIEDPDDATALRLPVEVPNDVNFPNLERYADWLGVFFFADSQRRPYEEFRSLYKAGEIPVRCVVVVRDPDPGVADDGRFDLDVDPESWGFGEVMRHRWTFRFHELMPDGSIETSERVMPESGRAFYRRQVRAYERGEQPPQRAENELAEGTWRWDAALQVMPRPPAITKENQALLYAGWTLPAASGSVLALIFALAFALAPERVKREPADG